MRILYLLDRPELGGGVKVVYQHAALLAGRGHQVWVAARGPSPGWVLPADEAAAAVEHLDYSHLPEGQPPEPPRRLDLVIATYWTTLAPAARLAAEQSGTAAAHLCQGYEPDWPHQRHRAAEIAAAYAAAPLPTLVVSPQLAERLAERHGRRSVLVPPPLDPRFRPRFRLRPRRRPWIAVAGIFEAEVKGVPTALEAVRRLRERGVGARLLRISVRSPGAEERAMLEADRFLVAVPPERVAAELARCDLLLFPVNEGEGFGLPLLEALACGVPAVASDLPTLAWIGDGACPLVPTGDPDAFAAAAERVLGSTWRWRQVRRRGRRAVRRFAPREVAGRLETGVRWAVEAEPPGGDGGALR